MKNGTVWVGGRGGKERGVCARGNAFGRDGGKERGRGMLKVKLWGGK